MKHKGSCHCGAIRFEFSGPEITDGVRCNCSLCKRKGVMMATFTITADELSIISEEGVLAAYQFGTGAAQHFFCRRCGIYPFHTLMSKPDHYRVNTGCIEAAKSSSLPFTVFDGAAI